MKKLLCILCILSSFAFATPAEVFAKLGYQPTYAKALEVAKQKNRPIMVVFREKTCPWCRKLEQQVLKREIINTKVQANFIAIVLESHDDIYPKKFKQAIFPTVVFVNSKDESVILTSYGYKPKKEFSKVIDEVVQKYKGMKQ